MLTAIRNNVLYRSSLIFFIGTIIAGFSNYLYQLLMGRMLSLTEFGTLASLVNFFAFAAVPVGALMTVTTQTVATMKARGQYGALHYLVKRLLKFFSYAGIGLTLILLALAIPVSRFLRLESLQAYVILSIGTGFVFLIAFLRGVLPGLQRFKELAVNTTLESLVKLCGATALVALSFGISGAAAAIAFASAIACTMLLSTLFKEFRGIPYERITLTALPRQYLIVGIWTLALTVLQNADILFVKRFFTAEETGMYAAMSILGKVIFFVSTSITGVLLPISTELYEGGNHEAHRRVMKKALLLFAIIGAGGLLMYSLFPRIIVHMLFGVRYSAFINYLPWFALIAVNLSFVQLLCTYFLSIRHRWFLWILGAASTIEVLLFFLRHGSIVQMLTTVSIVSGSLALFLLLVFWADPQRNRTII